MNTKLVIVLCGLVLLAGLFLVPLTESAVAFALVGLLVVVSLALFRNYTDEKRFITEVFLLALALRMAFGILVQVYDLRDFFGGDANTYDAAGTYLIDVWAGAVQYSDNFSTVLNPSSGVGFGMVYLVAAIYRVIGRNIFAAQSVYAVIGAAWTLFQLLLLDPSLPDLNSNEFQKLVRSQFPNLQILPLDRQTGCRYHPRLERP